jgi:ribosome recycling factor
MGVVDSAALFIFLIVSLFFDNASSYLISRSVPGMLRCNTQLGMEFAWKSAKKGAEDKMTKSLESISSQFSSIRSSGGCNPAILDRVMVASYGMTTPLNQVARISSSGAQQLVVEPFDKGNLKSIESAISSSDLNLTPSNDGTVIRINLPPLTEERRKDLVKLSKTVCEDGKISIRNIRRCVVDEIKLAEKNKDISKDNSRDYQV